MGLPQILVTFQSKGLDAIRRSARGIVALILRDDTVENPQGEDRLRVYKSITELDYTKWSEKNMEYLRLAFVGVPSRVLVVRMATTEADLNAALTTLRDLRWNWLAVPGISDSEKTVLAAWIKEQRDEHHKTFKAVLPSVKGDHEGIVNFTTGGITVLEGEKKLTYTAAEFCARMAGLLAGLSLAYSCTYRVMEDVVAADVPSDPDERIDTGELILIFDTDCYRIGRGVTSLTSSGPAKSADRKKIKIMEGMDLYMDDIRDTYKQQYVGKCINDYDNKQAFVAAVNDYHRALEGDVLDRSHENLAQISLEAQRNYLESQGVNTEDMSDVQILQGNTGSGVFLQASIKFVDAMEDLNMIVDM